MDARAKLATFPAGMDGEFVHVVHGTDDVADGLELRGGQSVTTGDGFVAVWTNAPTWKEWTAWCAGQGLVADLWAAGQGVTHVYSWPKVSLTVVPTSDWLLVWQQQCTAVAAAAASRFYGACSVLA
jgi:hypothetical protein